MDKSALQQLMAPLFPGLLGVELDEATKERVVASLVVRPDLCTAGGILHGGAVMAFADTLGAVATVLNLPEGAGTTTVESKTNFFAGVTVGTRVLGECTPLHRGRSTMVWQTAVRTAAGKPCALVIQTQLVISK